MNENYLDGRTYLHRQLDALIDWYDTHKPGITEIEIGVTRGTAMRYGLRPKERGGQIVYRGRLLLFKGGRVPRPTQCEIADSPDEAA